MIVRLYCVAVLLVASAIGMNRFVRQPEVPPATPLAQFPLRMSGWKGSSTPLSARTLTALDLSDYLNRIYTGPGGEAVGLYIAYYPRQRFGDDIHSPKNCLPGAGWQVATSRVVPLTVAGATIRVNEYIVARGLDRDLVLYWYQQAGRVVASEYWSKAYLVWDGLTRRRSDAALVRVAVPIQDGHDAAAAASGARFVRILYPKLNAYIPR